MTGFDPLPDVCWSHLVMWRSEVVDGDSVEGGGEGEG